MYQTILVPIDASDTARRGLSEAIALAQRLGSALHILHVLDYHMLFLDMSGMACLPDGTKVMREAGEQVLREAQALAAAAGVASEVALAEQVAPVVADAIIDEAVRCKADLIVMGTHGRRGVRHMVMGSDAEGVVRRATVPVLLVRADPTTEI